MILRKFYIFGILNLLILSNAFGSTSKPNLISERQAYNYIEHILSSLFIVNNHSGSYERDLKSYFYDVRSKLLYDLGRYPGFFSFSKVYDTNELYNEIINESIKFIEDKSFKYALEEINKFYVQGIDEDLVVRNSVEILINELRNKVQNASYLEDGVFSNYFGVPLKNKINKIIKNEIKHQMNNSYVSNSHVYSTPDCPVCFEEFGVFAKRLFLDCGHNICADCLRDWFDQKGFDISCPLCRAKIDISSFLNEL